VTGAAGSGAGPKPRVPPNCDLTLGMTCVDKSRPGVTVWTMPAGEHMANPVGVVQGGFLAAFADSAMAAATVTNLQGAKAYAANTELKISFLRGAPVGEALTCTARVIGGGRRVTFVEAEIADAWGRLVAKASSTYLLTPRE
jgi:acyl-CoA thioesterase